MRLLTPITDAMAAWRWCGESPLFSLAHTKALSPNIPKTYPKQRNIRYVGHSRNLTKVTCHLPALVKYAIRGSVRNETGLPGYQQTKDY